MSNRKTGIVSEKQRATGLGSVNGQQASDAQLQLALASRPTLAVVNSGSWISEPQRSEEAIRRVVEFASLLPD